MTITLRQESADGATTKNAALNFQELDNNFIHLLRQGTVTVRGDSGTDQSIGEADKDSILQIAGGTNVTTAISSDSAGETVVTINATGSAVDFSEGVVAGSNISVTSDSAGQVTVSYAGSAIDNVVEDTTPQLGGTLDGQANTVQDIQLENYKETIHALSYSANISPDVSNGNVQEITLTGDVTFDGFSNAEDGQSMTLIIHQDGTGTRTFSEGLDSAGRMLFAGGSSTLSTAANSTDIITIVFAGGIYYASLATNFS